MTGLAARRPPPSEAGAEGGGEEKRRRLVGSAPPPWGFSGVLVCLKRGGASRPRGRSGRPLWPGQIKAFGATPLLLTYRHIYFMSGVDKQRLTDREDFISRDTIHYIIDYSIRINYK